MGEKCELQFSNINHFLNHKLKQLVDDDLTKLICISKYFFSSALFGCFSGSIETIIPVGADHSLNINREFLKAGFGKLNQNIELWLFTSCHAANCSGNQKIFLSTVQR